MKVLFVYRFYGKDLGNSVIDFQKVSLFKSGIQIIDFYIENGGFKSYIYSIFLLNKFLNKKKFDLIHAHYSFSGIVAAIASRKPVVCSLLGSDILQLGKLHLFLVRLFSKFLWKTTLVKTNQMKRLIPDALVLPNGVDLSNFRSIDKKHAINKTRYPENKKHIVFLAQDANSKVKNLNLVKNAIKLIADNSIELHIISGKQFDELPYHYNSADILILSSLTEGSPNVIKEAMACNCPIVSTDVGDVRWVIGNTEGCYICSYEPEDVAEKIKLALEFARTKGRTNGRQRIIELGLESESIAKRIVDVYKQVIEKYGDKC